MCYGLFLLKDCDILSNVFISRFNIEICAQGSIISAHLARVVDVQNLQDRVEALCGSDVRN